MEKVMMGAIRRALGGTHGTSKNIMRAETGVPTMEATTCVAVVRAWGLVRQYGNESKLRIVWERQMKDVVSGLKPAAGSMAVRTIWAMREIFGEDGAEKRIRADISKAEYKRPAKEEAVRYFQKDMERCLQATESGRQFLMLKPKFGMAKWLECVATSQKLCVNPMAARFVQMRGG
jgi:hypothetical protein